MRTEKQVGGAEERIQKQTMQILISDVTEVTLQINRETRHSQ